MADLIQITTPAATRDYTSHNQNNRQQNIQQNPTGQVFDLGNQTQVVKTNDRSQDQAQQNLKDEGGSVLMRSAADAVKNPSSALNTAKALISRETISLIRETGDSETLGKLTEFASEVMLTPESLSGDMAAQQKGATIFGDKLWSVLKSLVDISGSEALTEGVADFAKAAADLSAKDEILRSLSSNFKYLASEAAPSKAVADELLAASKALSGSDAAANFTALKPTLLKLLNYTEKSLLLNDNTKNLLPLIVHSMSRYNDSPGALKESFESLLKLTESLNLSESQLNALGTGGEKLADMLTKLFDGYVMKNEYISPEAKQSALLDPAAAQSEAQMHSSVNLLAAGAKHMAGRIPADVLMNNLSSIDFTEGAEALRKALGSVLPNTPAMRNALQSLFNDLEATGDLDAMVNRLNIILENIDAGDSENMIQLAQGMNTALETMASSGRYTCSAATSMETLADFLTKNINNSFLHSLSGMNQGDMVQNLLTAPGVFTPLLHQFVPLDAFGIRAFGEMWIDPNADELVESTKNKRGVSGSDESGNHMFLCFDVEDTGYFELEIYEKDKNMSVMLLCPDKLESVFVPIRETIPKIAAENGYKVTASIVEGIKAKRTLDQVFPKLSEQRTGLNVKV